MSRFDGSERIPVDAGWLRAEKPPHVCGEKFVRCPEIRRFENTGQESFAACPEREARPEERPSCFLRSTWKSTVGIAESLGAQDRQRTAVIFRQETPFDSKHIGIWFEYSTNAETDFLFVHNETGLKTNI